MKGSNGEGSDWQQRLGNMSGLDVKLRGVDLIQEVRGFITFIATTLSHEISFRALIRVRMLVWVKCGLDTRFVLTQVAAVLLGLRYR